MRVLVMLVLALGCGDRPMQVVRDAAPESMDGASETMSDATDGAADAMDTTEAPLPICNITQATNSITCTGLQLDGHFCMTNCALPDCLLIIPSMPVVWRCVPNCDACR